MIQGMTGGRPKEFDRDEALQAAVELFWEQGYQATSVDQLLERMGIGRQSLYNEFGDKESLFCAAIRHYQHTLGRELTAILEAPGSPAENIRRLFAGLIDRCMHSGNRGCMMVNSSIEFAGLDESPILQTLKHTYAELEKSLRRVLCSAIAADEVEADLDTRQWATFLAATIQGMMVMAKTGTTRPALRRVADSALQAVLG